ncbi:hypothetical protein SAMN05421855_101252 [Ulvibacter litoralis]|uniref:Uncharacterized protein n=1 Tax=Ulvibacter litoralis TaxID=227084 RepID=A0A1G7C9D8_9FLAO|nr:hypothetical protein GCM10008083_09370 [Ulvibacter litoralis]SDE35813.1 hypothetical protein SAMN05421855_101252 [Ulvibacter litoralis]
MSNILYYELNIDYIIETYCVNTDKPELQCNGKCHLSKQLQLVSQETNDSEGNLITNIISESFFPVYFQSEDTINFDTSLLTIVRLQNFYYSENYAYKLDYQLLKPPIS